MTSMENLSEEQRARADALFIARDVSKKTGSPFGPVTPADVPEIVDLAEYVVRGVHPMDRYTDEEKPDADNDA